MVRQIQNQAFALEVGQTPAGAAQVSWLHITDRQRPKSTWLYVGCYMHETESVRFPLSTSFEREVDERGRLALDGKRVSLDALHTQSETARALVLEHGADYLLTVKGNQLTLKEKLERLVPTPPVASPLHLRRPWPAPRNATKAGMKSVPSTARAARPNKRVFRSPPEPRVCPAKPADKHLKP